MWAEQLVGAWYICSVCTYADRMLIKLKNTITVFFTYAIHSYTVPFSKSPPGGEKTFYSVLQNDPFFVRVSPLPISVLGGKLNLHGDLPTGQFHTYLLHSIVLKMNTFTCL